MNLSPSPNRVARVCVVIVQDDNVLMVETEHTARGWTLPGGGVDAHETLEEAALREAWEEAGATVEIGRELFTYPSWSGHTAHCFEARLVHLEPSPENRRLRWINPLDPDWREDPQVKLILEHTNLFGGGVA
jgi:8-oxo-dGTP pyrophosphatase MutT (NUDIX family)